MAEADMQTPAGSPSGAQPAGGENYLTVTRGFRSWAFTLDHKRIGVMYLVSIMASLALGGFFAMLIRTELAEDKPVIMEKLAVAIHSITGDETGPAEAEETDQAGGASTPAAGESTFDRATAGKHLYNHVFTLHGAIMIFLFIIPGIPAALGNFVLPIMLGAKDVAFPRLNLASYYFWLLGAAFFLLALVTGGIDTGWTLYPPYSTTTDSRVLTAGLGIFVLGFSSMFTGINFIVTIHTLRPPGMTWFKLPLLLWSLYATAVIQVLATPVLAITVLLLAAELLLNVGIFDPELGGDPILFQHFFWFYSHPAVYIMILPAMGIISELVPTFSNKHIFGYKFIAFSSLAIALLGFLVWGHHMFTSGQSALVSMIFSALTFSVSIPSAIKVFNWLATMYKGSIWLATPMCYAMSFILMFGIGGLTGLFLGSLATNVHVHDTYFIVAHFHYTMMGGVLLAFLGGLHYWWPKMTGRMFSDLWGRIACLIVFAGFNLTFFPQFIMGTQGMPRRYYAYDERFLMLNRMSTAGAFLLATGMLLILWYLLYSLFAGRRAPGNPWGAATLEWQCASPPPLENFATPPKVGDPYDYSNLHYDPATGGYVFAAADVPPPSDAEGGL